MENRRLVNQEDRVFNERLKLVNAKLEQMWLPRVRRHRNSELNSSATNPLTSSEDEDGNISSSKKRHKSNAAPHEIADQRANRKS